MSRISASDRALIDAALARTTPEERRVPTGASALAVDYIWEDNRLIARDPEQRGYQRLRWTGRSGAVQRASWSLSDAERGAILADLKKGLRLVDIAARHRVNISTISYLRDGPAPRRTAPIDQDAVLAALKEGLTYKQVAERCDCSTGPVGRIARAHGLGAVANDLTARITALADGQRSLGEIARMVGCGREAVKLRRVQLGLDIPNGKSGRKPGVAA